MQRTHDIFDAANTHLGYFVHQNLDTLVCISILLLFLLSPFSVAAAAVGAAVLSLFMEFGEAAAVVFVHLFRYRNPPPLCWKMRYENVLYRSTHTHTILLAVHIAQYVPNA